MITIIRIGLFALFFLSGIVVGNAQQKIMFKVINDNHQAIISMQQFDALVFNTSDTLVIDAVLPIYLESLKEKAWEHGFLSFSIDSLITVHDNLYQAELYLGVPYRWAKLHFDNLSPELKNAIGIKAESFDNKVISLKKFNTLCDKIVQHYENTGYPFANVQLSVTDVQSGIIEGYLKVRPEQKVNIDSIVIESEVKISRNYIQNYLGIHQGQLYNEKALRGISKKLSELSFLQEAAKPQMTFTIADSRLWLYLKQRKANQINGLIGLQPGNTQSGSRFLLTVDALLNLKNALGYGETIAAVFQQLQPGSPRFNFKVEYPYIYNTPFSMDVNFDLYKKDTLFNRVTIDIGLKYLLNHRDYVRIAYVNNANRVIAPDINFVKANKRLPNSIDVTNGGLNLGFNLDNTDYALNPRRGYYVQGQLQYLNRKIIKNAAITSIIDGSGFDYTAIYDTLSLLNRQYKAQVSLGLYIPATKQIVLKLAYNGAYLSGDNLFLNELFQIGGFNLLRGFDEMSLFVNHYQILTAELRLLFNVNSYFYVFSDNAYIQAKYNQIQNSNYPMGLGLGINLENQGGVFKIAVGVGKLEASNFMLRQAKLHFGYVAYF